MRFYLVLYDPTFETKAPRRQVAPIATSMIVGDLEASYWRIQKQSICCQNRASKHLLSI